MLDEPVASILEKYPPQPDESWLTYLMRVESAQGRDDEAHELFCKLLSSIEAEICECGRKPRDCKFDEGFEDEHGDV